MKNVGMIDSIIRIVVGIIIVISFFYIKSNLKYLCIFGLIPIITGIIGYCPTYKFLGINTRKKGD